MPRPSDLFRNTGTGGPSQAPKNTLNLNASADKPQAGQNDPDHVTAQKPNMGHNLHSSGKAQGGSGGASTRPKV